MASIKTIAEIAPTKEAIDKAEKAYKYQDNLTPKLDNLAGDFDQNIINEIVL